MRSAFSEANSKAAAIIALVARLARSDGQAGERRMKSISSRGPIIRPQSGPPASPPPDMITKSAPAVSSDSAEGIEASALEATVPTGRTAAVADDDRRTPKN